MASAFRVRPNRLRRALLAFGAVGVLLLVGWLGVLPTTGDASATVSIGPRPSEIPAAAAHPAANGSAPPCAKITATVCVSVASSTESQIVPSAGSFIASVEPNPRADLALVIKSRYLLNATNPPKTGPNSPIALNVTGVLWNGDPFSGPNSSTVWHANGNSPWWTGPVNRTAQNRSYPWWYTVVISWQNGNGTANVFPGETITWWIELTNQTGNVFHHLIGPKFQFTYANAWPFSPYPGSAQFAGPSSTYADINVSEHPSQPNWNDSVHVIVNTTAADGAPVNASIGTALLDFIEVYNGATIVSTNFAFKLAGNGTVGAASTVLTIPASYAQLSGSVVTFHLVVTDTAGDQLQTPAYTYTVGGNGTFLSGTFSDDIGVQSSPSSVATAAGVAVSVLPGQDVNLTITSLNTGTSINAAEIVEYFSYPAINEKAVVLIPMARASSTVFDGSIPGAPIGSFVNFTVDAWDFAQHQLVSTFYSFTTPTFAAYVPFVPGNASFLYVYVYDNGSHQWAANATVTVTGPNGFYNTVCTTTYGICYPNESSLPQVPLLLVANDTYHIVVNDPAFVPTVGGIPKVVEANVTALHTMTARQTLVAAPNFMVVQESNSILFYLNATPPPPTVSPPATSSGVPIGAVIGFVATIATAIPLYLWWREIRARRKEEEKRVTL